MQRYNLLLRLGVANVFEPDFLARIEQAEPLRGQQAVWQQVPDASSQNRMLANDWRYTLAENHLPKVTGSTSLAGVAVGHPFLEQALVDFSLRLPTDHKLKGLKLRWFFKEALRGFLPDEIITKKKQGFGLPFGVWATRHAGLREFARESLLSLLSLARRGIERAPFERQLLDVHLPAHHEIPTSTSQDAAAGGWWPWTVQPSRGSGEATPATASSCCSRAGRLNITVFHRMSVLTSKYACTRRLRMATITGHSTPGAAARPASDTRAAASPMICTTCSSAMRNIVSLSRSCCSRPWQNRIAVRAASAMWRIRIRSSGDILRLGRSHHLIAEMTAQVARRAQIHAAPAHQGRQLDLDAHHVEERRGGIGLELHQQIDVAVRTCGAFQARPEQRQLTDAVAPANGRQLSL
jgi:hypothetical protein